MLAFDIARLPEHAAARELDQQGSGRFDVCHVVGHVAHGNSADSGFLYHALNQTHGLMALGSNRHQEQHIDPCCLDPANKLRNSVRDQGLDVVDIAEAVVRLG